MTPLAQADGTVAGLLVGATARLRTAGVPTPRLDAELLLGLALGVERQRLLIEPERAPAAEQRARFADLVRRRAERVPVSRLCGEREFWSLRFLVAEATLDPRPDSETLVEAALDHLADRDAPWRVADWGTGTGCLLLAVLHERPHAWGLGIDASAAAAQVASANARRLGLAARAAFVAADWAAATAGRFDVILCNPPYISRQDLASIDPEAAYDPALALTGGADGLDAYRRLAPQIGPALAPGGRLVLEIGAGQDSSVSVILESVGLTLVETRRDLAGRARCIIARSAEN